MSLPRGRPSQPRPLFPSTTFLLPPSTMPRAQGKAAVPVRRRVQLALKRQQQWRGRASFRPPGCQPFSSHMDDDTRRQSVLITRYKIWKLTTSSHFTSARFLFCLGLILGFHYIQNIMYSTHIFFFNLSESHPTIKPLLKLPIFFQLTCFSFFHDSFILKYLNLTWTLFKLWICPQIISTVMYHEAARSYLHYLW